MVDEEAVVEVFKKCDAESRKTGLQLLQHLLAEQDRGESKPLASIGRVLVLSLIHI